MKKYLAEFVGTLALTLAVIFSLNGAFPVATPVIAALTLGFMVYVIGQFSGAHLNPAVTLGLWAIGRGNVKDTLGYLVSQFIGAGIAIWVARLFIPVPVSLIVVDSFRIGFAEALGTFFFAFGIASVVYGKTPALMSGVVVGGSLLLGISLAAIASNGVLNPAVALGIGSFNLAYLLGPIVGSVLGMNAYRYFARA